LINGQELSQKSVSNLPVYHLNNEKRLIDDLFKNYQVKFGRPVNNMTEKVIVNFEVFLIQLIDLVNNKNIRNINNNKNQFTFLF
jgi:hypothetical protein